MSRPIDSYPLPIALEGVTAPPPMQRDTSTLRMTVSRAGSAQDCERTLHRESVISVWRLTQPFVKSRKKSCRIIVTFLIHEEVLWCDIHNLYSYILAI